ncbi:MAG: TolC family protein [Phycisphaerales bacterium JB039]
MRPRLRTVLVPIALVLLGAAPPALAQAQEQAEGGQSPFGSAPTVDVSFRGGTVGDYLKALKSAAEPTPVNVVASDEVLRLKANPVDLREVQIDTALELLSSAGASERLLIDRMGGSRGSAPVYTLIRIASPQQAFDRQGRPASPSINVYSVRELIEPEPGAPAVLTISPETILSSIDAALKLQGPSEDREVMFHEDAAIIIIRGQDRELAVVSNLLSEIRRDLKDRRKSAMEITDRVDGLEHQVMVLESQLAIGQVELDGARRRLDQMQQLAEKAAVSASEVEEAKTELMRAEAEVRAVESQLNVARRNLAAIRASAPAGDDRQSLLDEIARLKAEVTALRAQLGRSGDR